MKKIMSGVIRFLVGIFLLTILPFVHGCASFGRSFSDGNDIKSFAVCAVEKGWRLYSQGDFNAALKRFHQATIIDPEYAAGYFGEALIYSIQKDYDLAICGYKKTIEIDPKFAPAYSNLGRIYLHKENPVVAHQMISKAISLAPSNGDVYVAMVIYYCYMEEFDKAWDYLRKAEEKGATIDGELINKLKEASGVRD